ncbi:MAG: hypothetical protein ACLSA6_03160 [Holdemania massiliensis]
MVLSAIEAGLSYLLSVITCPILSCICQPAECSGISVRIHGRHAGAKNKISGFNQLRFGYEAEYLDDQQALPNSCTVKLTI